MSLHWGMALIIILNMPGPLGVDKGGEDQTRAVQAVFHASLGTIIFLLMLFRLGWRLAHPVARPKGLAGWQTALTMALHNLLYLAVITQCFLGLAMAAAHSGHLKLFWVFDLSRMGTGLPWSYLDILPFHSAGMKVLMVLIGLHIAQMLYHFLGRPGSFVVRMLPEWMRNF
jgi:cytochrome b561